MLATSVLHNTNITYDLAFFGKGVVRLTKRVVRLMKRVVRLMKRVMRLVKGVVRVAAPYIYEWSEYYFLKRSMDGRVTCLMKVLPNKYYLHESNSFLFIFVIF